MPSFSVFSVFTCSHHISYEIDFRVLTFFWLPTNHYLFSFSCFFPALLFLLYFYNYLSFFYCSLICLILFFPSALLFTNRYIIFLKFVCLIFLFFFIYCFPPFSISFYCILKNLV